MKANQTILFCAFLTLFQYGFGQDVNETKQIGNKIDLIEKTEKISYCQLFESEQFNEKTIEIKTLMYSPGGNDSDEVFYSTDCNNKDYFAKAEFSSETKNLSTLAKEFEKQTDENSSSFALVSVKGRFLIRFSADFGHLGRFRAKFIVQEIKSAKILNEKPEKPNYKIDSPIISTSKALLKENFAVMLAAFGDNRYVILSDVLSDEIKILFNGKTIEAKRLIEYAKTEAIGIFEYRTGGLLKNGNEWKLKGISKVRLKDGMTKTFNHENTYIGQKDNTAKLIQFNVWEASENSKSENQQTDDFP